jgi:hypothetical protein
MEQQQLKQLMQQAYTTTKKPQTFSKNEKDVIAYFFFRLQNTYGISRMQAQWPDDNSLSLAKREFGKSIAKMSREEVNALFDELHAERQKGNDKFTFPDIDAILSLEKTKYRIARYHKLYIPHQLQPDSQKERREKNIIALAKLKEELGMNA